MAPKKPVMRRTCMETGTQMGDTTENTVNHENSLRSGYISLLDPRYAMTQIKKDRKSLARLVQETDGGRDK
jgi:hypothetical protein